MVVTLRPQFTPFWLIDKTLTSRLDFGDVSTNVDGVTFNFSGDIKPAIDPIVGNQIVEL